jgi:thiol-disulfide isomerase/thioredoxin
MSDNPAADPRSPFLKWALWGVAAVGVAAVVYIIAQALIHPSAQGDLKSLAKGEMSKLEIPAAANPAPVNSFYDGSGKSLRIADLKGKVVVLNLWATWCGPCVTEMPTLAKLAAEYQGKDVAVVALSVDNEKAKEKAKLFIAQHAPLAFYNDPNMKFPFALNPPAPGMPTTIIYGRDGLERARISGAADWAGADAKAVIDAVLAES